MHCIRHTLIGLFWSLSRSKTHSQCRIHRFKRTFHHCRSTFLRSSRFWIFCLCLYLNFREENCSFSLSALGAISMQMKLPNLNASWDDINSCQWCAMCHEKKRDMCPFCEWWKSVRIWSGYQLVDLMLSVALPANMHSMGLFPSKAIPRPAGDGHWMQL